MRDLPVIFISAYGRDETIARALEAGAEDYVVKPFSKTELTARIGAALRRRAEPDLFVLGELALDYAHRRVTLGGRKLELTATEYELLRVLSLGAGRVATYDALLRQVWSGRSHANPKLVRAYVQRLRRKLGDDTSQPTLHPHRASRRLPHAAPRTRPGSLRRRTGQAPGQARFGGKRSRRRPLSGQESAPSFVSRSARRIVEIGGKSPFACSFCP